MKMLVTGAPGSGKTSLVRYAISRGHPNFIDADEVCGLCEWRSFETGQVVGSVQDFKVKESDEWHRLYGWYWNKEALTNFFADLSKVVLCGSAENVVEMYPIFDRIVILRKTKEELFSNLVSSRRKNPFGKTEGQREIFMDWQNHLIESARGFETTVLEGNDIARAFEELIQTL